LREVHNEELHNLVLFVKYNYNYEVEEDEVGGIGGMNGGEEEK
jgi:hypothetical protein